MTPHAFNVWVGGWSERAQNEVERGMSMAWHGAAFQRAKRLPPLNKVLDRPAKDEPLPNMIRSNRIMFSFICRSHFLDANR